MVLSLRHWLPIPCDVPQRRRVIVVGATEAGVSCAFHLGVWAMLIDQREMSERQMLVEAATPPDAMCGVRRWEPPQLTSGGPPLLLSLTSGETRLGDRVTAINVCERRLELSTGESFVYDKLVITLSMSDLQRLIVDETPGRLRSEESWRYWLNARDVELLDESTQRFFGDLDEQAAGKRVADNIRDALSTKFSSKSVASKRAAALFHPRIVGSVQ